MSAQTLHSPEGSDAADDSERRVAQRFRTLKRAKILFNNNFSTFDCIVRNISATGALLTLDEAVHLPREFNIRIGEEKTVHFAKLVYRRGMFAGIHFLDADASAPAEEAHVRPAAAEHVAQSSAFPAAALPPGQIRRIEPEILPLALRRAAPWARFGA
ncbi:PilZ domain-containing protein [Antarcticirhabdus aurantiaca]|uniref:PilZ domain-containing protein n=1 Tax=Antarcticirhabdus aurantiaca TaxID=2606717 RepID=A0ACD4NI67_9HYPH|nr:PilZ domain-containing protein [Antarcticirhabdus aurantiaca]WAJ26477.1 PilZ domain-containing protein [Jeongeuplla avenae]